MWTTSPPFWKMAAPAPPPPPAGSSLLITFEEWGTQNGYVPEMDLVQIDQYYNGQQARQPPIFQGPWLVLGTPFGLAGPEYGITFSSRFKLLGDADYEIIDFVPTFSGNFANEPTSPTVLALGYAVDYIPIPGEDDSSYTGVISFPLGAEGYIEIKYSFPRTAMTMRVKNAGGTVVGTGVTWPSGSSIENTATSGSGDPTGGGDFASWKTARITITPGQVATSLEMTFQLGRVIFDNLYFSNINLPA